MGPQGCLQTQLILLSLLGYCFLTMMVSNMTFLLFDPLCWMYWHIWTILSIPHPGPYTACQGFWGLWARSRTIGVLSPFLPCTNSCLWLLSFQNGKPRGNSKGREMGWGEQFVPVFVQKPDDLILACAIKMNICIIYSHTHTHITHRCTYTAKCFLLPKCKPN